MRLNRGCLVNSSTLTPFRLDRLPEGTIIRRFRICGMVTGDDGFVSAVVGLYGPNVPSLTEIDSGELFCPSTPAAQRLNAQASSIASDGVWFDLPVEAGDFVVSRGRDIPVFFLAMAAGSASYMNISVECTLPANSLVPNLPPPAPTA